MNSNKMPYCLRISFLLLFIFSHKCQFGQVLTLKAHWTLQTKNSIKIYSATVPSNILQTIALASNQDPLYSNHFNKYNWVDSLDWMYKTTFNLNKKQLKSKIKLNIESIDTYADVFINGKIIGKCENMFRPYTFDITKYVKKSNQLEILIYSNINTSNYLANQSLPLIYPDHPRVHTRKAQYQYGWDWGPIMSSGGINSDVQIIIGNQEIKEGLKKYIHPDLNQIRFHQKNDSIGRSFYFSKNNQPIFIKGANWIPMEFFLTDLKANDYRRLLYSVKAANINMLRVWGGGIYEKDIFYDLCDSLGILVWQDMMFACGMYPAHSAFLENVKMEIEHQINRLASHPCIVLWCGNNEVDEAWQHWGWQKQYNMHGADSTKIWKENIKLFRDSLPKWIKDHDTQNRAYIASSPEFGWGNSKSTTSGDSHYWGFWWGMEDWEIFKHKTGRFVSEWGMQALPNMKTIQKYITQDSSHHSKALNARQRANAGNLKLRYYMNKYMFDTTQLDHLNMAKYTYLSQATQYYLIKNIATLHLMKSPHNMGSLLWQYNDCWPGISWSITDYSRTPKGGWYAIKNVFDDKKQLKLDQEYPKYLSLKKPAFTVTQINERQISIESDQDAYFIYVFTDQDDLFWNDNYFHLKKGEIKTLELMTFEQSKVNAAQIRLLSFYDLK